MRFSRPDAGNPLRLAQVSATAMNEDILPACSARVRLRAAVFYYVSCRRVWAAEAPRAEEIAGAVMPGAEHVMEYHMIAKGEGWAATAGLPPCACRQATSSCSHKAMHM